MEDWIILSIAVAIYYGIVAIVLAFNKKHKELCDPFVDYRLIALFWFPFILLVLVTRILSLFFDEE